MRKTIYIVLAALGLCLFAGYGSSDKEKVSLKFHFFKVLLRVQ